MQWLPEAVRQKKIGSFGEMIGPLGESGRFRHIRFIVVPEKAC